MFTALQLLKSPSTLTTPQVAVEWVSLLVDHGADLSVRDEHGDTVWHYLCVARPKKGHAFTLSERTATSARACLSLTNKRFQTPAHSTQSSSSFLLFLLLGADMSAQDSDGNTPLHTFIASHSLRSKDACDVFRVILGQTPLVSLSVVSRDTHEAECPCDMSACSRALSAVNKAGESALDLLRQAPEDSLKWLVEQCTEVQTLLTVQPSGKTDH